MARYYAMLLISLFILLISVVSLWFIFTEKWKRGRRYKIPFKQTAGSLFGLLAGGLLFTIFVPDLPDVIHHRPTYYEGMCEIDKETGKHAHLEAWFGDHAIWFDIYEYDKVREGQYYCKVKYYPHSDEGESLRLYTSKGGKEIETN
ncbi:hypothetical protein [Neobacillus terrae]|uniref:hypothetical protein n=1 Tax=Neobacillus terrae TaxID=3034837 RepID=UPI00140E48F3|nr:hypothetical protein [Neobacillus terrae]NHM30711.1 hypothetical protein [Neobacillus terrae]